MSLLSSLFGNAKQTSAGVTTVLDMVTYAAGLVSNRNEVGPMLDPVRRITAELSPGQTPSPADTRTLLNVYLQVEQYLTTKEPLRAFTKDELRGRLPAELKEQIVTYETNHKE